MTSTQTLSGSNQMYNQQELFPAGHFMEAVCKGLLKFPYRKEKLHCNKLFSRSCTKCYLAITRWFSGAALDLSQLFPV